jgi:tetratricopeptide (TPR) repeat protein
LAALVRSGRGPLLANMGDFESAWEDVAFVDERAKASGHEQVLTWKYNALINTLLNEGRWDEVIAASEQVFQKFGYRYPIHEISALIFLDRRREVEQLVAAERIENKLRRPGSSIWNIYLLALINAYQGNWTDAENDFEVALKGFEECGGLLGVGHTLYQRASYYRDRSRGVDALSDARRALEIFEKCGAKPMAQRSKELIEAIGLL